MKKRTASGLSSGHTFIELTIVFIVIGSLLAIIIPMAIRTNIQAKYATLRQTATELAGWGMEWAQRNLDSQSSSASCNIDKYVATLKGYVGDRMVNWRCSDCMDAQCSGDAIEIKYSVADMMGPDNHPLNPFNGLSYFNDKNSGESAQSGLLYLYKYPPVNTPTPGENYNYYYFVYTGANCQTASQWHAGMGQGLNGLSLAELQNGVFMAKIAP